MGISYLTQSRLSSCGPKTNNIRLSNNNVAVLLHKNTPHLLWKIAIIVELLKGSDGICRGEEVKMWDSGAPP